MKTNEQKNQIIKKYNNPITFYLLSILIPWLLWFLAGYFSHIEPYTQARDYLIGILSITGLMAPFALAVIIMMNNRDLKKDFLNRFFNFKSIKKEYILITVFVMLISILVAQTISLFFGYSPAQFQLRGSFTFTSAVFPVWFLLIAAPVLEELAWHSYGTDCLRSRLNLFNSSLLFAIFWGFWHFPLSTIKGYYHSNLIESGIIYSVNFIVSLIPFVIIMNWIYYKTNRNIILPIIFHITAVFFNEIFATHPMSKVIQTVLLLILSAYIVIKEKELFFKM
jgi:membrane protease YdiL (CAAX protease family)